MNLIDLLRLIRKHLVLLVLAPVILALLVVYLTRHPVYTFTSETTLYTGIASGGGIEMSKSFNFFANNTAFDNLINVIKSRQTQQEVGIRLFAMHLMLDNYNPKYISKESFIRFKSLTPPAMYALVAKSGGKSTTEKPPIFEKKVKVTVPKDPHDRVIEKYFHTVKPGETMYSIATRYKITVEELRGMNDIEGNEIVTGQVLKISPFSNEQNDDPEPTGDITEETPVVDTIAGSDTFSFSRLDSSGMVQWLPGTIDLNAYEQTVENLINYMAKSDTNFLYKLINFTHRHYSVKAISAVNVQRIANSDLVKLRYEADDPGICQLTLALLTEVCIKNYKQIKENRSDAVVKYFEYQVRQSSIRLRIAEDKLLKFNKDNNIINYYEQSKAVAVVKEDLDVLYNNKNMVLEGSLSAIKRIESQLGSLQKIQLNSAKMMELRNRLLAVNSKISAAEIFRKNDSLPPPNVNALKEQAEKIKSEIRGSVNELYQYSHSTAGLPISSLLSDWLKNVLLYEETRAGLAVLGERIKEFRKQYAIYAPAGANLKRIEREINVSEQAYLELLHGLNLAKLKMQDIELSSNIKAVDPPYFPLSANPTKRLLTVIIAGLLGFLLVLVTILAMEYLDNTLRNPKRAAKKLNLACCGIFPKVYLKPQALNFHFIANRLLEITIQKLILTLNESSRTTGTKTILFFSTRTTEGKTVLIGNVAKKMISQGHKVLVLTYSHEALRRMEISQSGYNTSENGSPNSYSSFPYSISVFKRLLGYPDTRIDHDSPFLESPENYLSPDEILTYQIDETFQAVKSYQEILDKNHFRPGFVPDFVLIAIPPILYHSYPNELIESSELSLLICRANRTWDEADHGALTTFIKHLQQEPLFLLNGVEIPVVETVLGDLPKKRSIVSKVLKKVIRFQFFERYMP